MSRCELSKGDEAEGGELAENRKGLAFDIARDAEAGPNASEIGIIIARVRDEFPRSGGNPIEKSMESHSVEGAGAGNAECAAGGREALFCENAMPGGPEAAENADLRSAHEGGAGSGANGPNRLEWIAN
jgi:hypothetical protein